MDHAAGVYALIPEDDFKAFLSDPLTASIYFRDWCWPYFRQNPVSECVQMIGNLSSIHEDLAADMEWLALRLSGSSLPPPGSEAGNREQHDEFFGLVHKRILMKASFFLALFSYQPQTNPVLIPDYNPKQQEHKEFPLKNKVWIVAGLALGWKGGGGCPCLAQAAPAQTC